MCEDAANIWAPQEKAVLGDGRLSHLNQNQCLQGDLSSSETLVACALPIPTSSIDETIFQIVLRECTH